MDFLAESEAGVWRFWQTPRQHAGHVRLWFDPDFQTGTAFRREVDGRLLTFEPDHADPTLVRDSESSNRWIGASGQGHGPRNRSTQLIPLITTPAFDFGWYDYFPESDTYDGG